MYYSTAGKLKNTKMQGKPNEDVIWSNDEAGIYILVDGVSRDRENGIYPNPSPALEVSDIFVETVKKYLVEHRYVGGTIEIKKAFEIGNMKIEEFNCHYKGDFLPGTVGIVCLIRDYILYYGYIGDCYGRILTESNIINFSRCQTKLIAEHGKEFTAYEIRNHICNNRQHPYSYGVLNGQRQAMEFVETGKIDLRQAKRIIISSDGMEDYLGNLEFEGLKNMMAEELLQESIVSQKKEDDKSIIVIDLK